MASSRVELSARVKKLSKDFAFTDGIYRMPLEKMATWMTELEKVAVAEKPKVAAELIAMAMHLQREGKELTSLAVAQLYTFAAGVMNYSGKDLSPTPERPRTTGGWGAKR